MEKSQDRVVRCSACFFYQVDEENQGITENFVELILFGHLFQLVDKEQRITVATLFNVLA